MSDFAKVEQSLREEMTRIASSFFQRGYATGSAGNLSLLLPDGNLLATPTGSCLGNLDPQRLSKVAADGEWLSGDKPSKEVLFHLALYRNNPRCKAVVHLHSTWSTALFLPARAGQQQRYSSVHTIRGDADGKCPAGALLPTGR